MDGTPKWTVREPNTKVSERTKNQPCNIYIFRGVIFNNLRVIHQGSYDTYWERATYLNERIFNKVSIANVGSDLIYKTDTYSNRCPSSLGLRNVLFLVPPPRAKSLQSRSKNRRSPKLTPMSPRCVAGSRRSNKSGPWYKFCQYLYHRNDLFDRVNGIICVGNLPNNCIGSGTSSGCSRSDPAIGENTYAKQTVQCGPYLADATPCNSTIQNIIDSHNSIQLNIIIKILATPTHLQA